jgi:DNA modification methylase
MTNKDYTKTPLEELKNTIHCADCLTFMKDIPDKSIDMVLTSPPYDNLRDYKGYTFDFEGIAKELYRVVKDGGVVVWVVGDMVINKSESGTSFKQALFFKEIGFNIHDTMIYKKNGSPYPEKTRYFQNFEYMFVFSKGTPKTIHLIQDRKNKWLGSWGKRSTRDKEGNLHKASVIVHKEYGTRFNIWEINNGAGFSTKDKIAFQHPAIFPEKLAEDHILSWSNEGDTVLDPMAGSGTTLKMAKKNNRNYIGIEISPEYIEIIKKRLNK